MTALRPELLRKLRAAIEKVDLQDATELICEHATECLALVSLGEDDYSVVGNTRFGGDPDLPPEQAWPTDPGDGQPRYANFIGQINFAELPPLTAGPALPPAGLLSIFVRSMESAADPVILDSLYFPEGPAGFMRRASPPEEELCDEYLVDLVPLKVGAVPTVSLAEFRKEFQTCLEEAAGEDAMLGLLEVEEELTPLDRMGQLLGFANASDARENLYRQLALGRLGQRGLQFNDYWDSMEEYEADVRDMPDCDYEQMRPGVVWLMQHREEVAAEAADWQLLLRLNSNDGMNLLINDSDPLYVFIRRGDLARAKFDDLSGEVTQG